MKVFIRSSHLLIVISCTTRLMVDGFTAATARDLHSKINSTSGSSTSATNASRNHKSNSALHSSLHERHQPSQPSNTSINTHTSMSMNKKKSPVAVGSSNASNKKNQMSSSSSLSVSSAAALPMTEGNNVHVASTSTSPKLVISDSKRTLQRRKRSWVEKSHKYYTTIMRNNTRRARGQIQRHNRQRRKYITTATDTTKNNVVESYSNSNNDNDEYALSEILIAHRRKDFYVSQQFYFAWKQIKMGKLAHAERIYRKLIEELKAQMMEDGDECTIVDYDETTRDKDHGHGLRTCDNSQLATTTLLLCLLLQRTNQVKATRAAFLQFFRIIRVQVDNDNTGTGTGMINCKDVNVQERQIVECTCSAKVLQAYALFEMKQGHVKKSYELVCLAVEMDKELEPVLSWKQFRDAKALVYQ